MMDFENSDNLCVHLWNDEQPANNFSTHLPVPLGHLDSSFKFALQSIQYDHSWKTFASSEQMITFLIYRTDDEGRFTADAEGADLTTSFNEQDLIVTVDLLEDLKISEVLGGTEGFQSIDVFHVSIPNLAYQSVKEIAELICTEITDREHESILSFQDDVNSRKLSFSPLIKNKIKIVFYAKYKEIAKALGFQVPANKEFSAYELDERASRKYTLIDRFDSILITSSLLRNELAGNRLIPILRKIPTKEKNVGEKVANEFHNLQFKSLRYGLTQITDMDIKIVDRYGINIPFSDDTVVSVDLVFKPSFLF